MLQFQDVTNAPYHEAQITLAYNTKQVDDPNAELDPMIPLCYGKLAQAHKREGTKYTVEEWRIVSMGYNPFEKDWHKHPLKANAAKLDKNLKPIQKPVKVLADDKRKEKEKKDRESLELVLSGDKSISLWLAAQDKETQDRYMAGTNRIMEQVVLPLLDRFAMYQQKNQKLFASGLSFVSFFNHIESRQVDPFWHIHVNIKASVLGLDGKYHALASDAITKNSALIDAAWQMAQARLLREEFGLQLTQTATKVDDRNDYLEDDEKNVFTFGVAGVTPELSKAYSKRSQEITDQLKKLGINDNSYEASELAQVSTRSQKTGLNATQLRDGWRKELAQDWGYTAEVANSLARAPQNDDRRIPTDQELLDTFERRHGDVAFTESQFKTHVFKQLMLSQPQDAIERRAEDLFRKQALAVHLHGKPNPYDAIEASTNPLERRALQHHLNLTAIYTARHFKDREDKFFADTEARKDETRHVIDKTEILKALDTYQAKRSTAKRKFEFTAGQIEAVVAATTEKGGVMAIEGMAGTGKTTVVNCIREEYEARGYVVLGTATAAKATGDLLRDAQLKGGNTSEILLKLRGIDGKPPTLTLTDKHVIILDEAGMTSGREICELGKFINDAGAKLICLGDSAQLQSVGASGMYRHIASKFVSTKMSDIQRQREDWAREMVSDAAAGRSFDSLLKLHEHGCISVHETTDERVKAIARDYLADRSDHSRKFIVASTNADTNTINREVQRRQLASGVLSTDMGVAVVEDREGFVRHFHVNERIVFDKKTKNMDPSNRSVANNADTGKVVRIEHRKGKLRAITVELDNGQELTLDATTAKNLKLGSALTTHKSQGSTVINSYLFASNTLANLHTFYVQVSRHKENTKLYLSKDQVNQIAEEARLAKPSDAQQGWAYDLIEKDLARNVIDEAQASRLRTECQTFQGCREYLNSHHEAYEAEASVSRQKVMQTQVLRDFISIFEAYGKANYKKSTLDYQVLDETHQQRTHEVRQALNKKQVPKPQSLDEAQPIQVVLVPSTEIKPKQNQKLSMSM